MIGEMFYWVLSMSVLGGAVILILLAMRRLRRFPRRFIYLMWAAPAIRLLIPVGLPSRYSLLSLFSGSVLKSVDIGKTGGFMDLTASNLIQAADQYFPFSYKSDLLRRIFEGAGLIWLTAACLAAAAAIYLYRRGMSDTGERTEVMPGICRSDKVRHPAVYGILRPVILIPKDLPDTECRYVIRHEQAHMRRKDNLFRLAAVLIACIHWFNPLIWISLKYFFEDMEISCDEIVMKELLPEEQKEYASAILGCAKSKSPFVSAFGGAGLRQRIESILSYRKMTALSALLCAAWTAAVLFVLLANAPT